MATVTVLAQPRIETKNVRWKPGIIWPGTTIRITVETPNASGTLADPATGTLKFITRSPRGQVTTYVYGTDAEVTKLATGRFAADITPSNSGRWFYRFQYDDASEVSRSVEGWFNVRSSGTSDSFFLTYENEGLADVTTTRDQVIAVSIMSGINALVGTTSVTVPSGDLKTVFSFIGQDANTGAVTLALNGGAALSLLMPDGSELAPGTVEDGRLVQFVRQGDDYYCTFDPTTPGAVLSALLPSAGPRGGDMNLAPRDFSLGADADVITGRENLAAWYKAVRDRHEAAPTVGDTVIGFLVGDSKVSGAGVTAGYQLDELLDRIAKERGFSLIDFGRFGYSGENSYYLSQHLAGVGEVMAHANFANCHLIIINVGTNDASTAATDGAQSLADSDTNIRAIIDRLRDTGASPAGRSVDDMSILLMGQTSANNTASPHYQQETLMREISSQYREIAREKQVAYVDCYRLFPRAHDDASWMDTVVSYGNSNVHPGDAFNAALVSQIGDLLFPLALASKAGAGPGVIHSDPTNAALPSTYRRGFSYHRAVSATGGWPVDGAVLTYRHFSDICLQMLFERNAPNGFQYRVSNGGSDAFSSWLVVPASVVSTNVTASSGFTLPGSEIMRTSKLGQLVNANGYVSVVSPGAVAAGTAIATVAAGNRPGRVQWGATIAAYVSGTTFEYKHASIGTDGVVTLREDVTVAATRLYLYDTWLAA